jgi:hypothetical protein
VHMCGISDSSSLDGSAEPTMNRLCAIYGFRSDVVFAPWAAASVRLTCESFATSKHCIQVTMMSRSSVSRRRAAWTEKWTKHRRCNSY